MGLSNEPRQSGKFLNFKEGKLINNGQSFESIENVRIVDMSIQEAEYNGKAYQKVTLFLQDEDTKFIYHLGFPLGSGYGYAFFAMSPNLDPYEKVTISGGSDKMDNGNSYGKMFISQNGKNLKWFFKKGEKAYDAIPVVKIVKVGKGKSATEVKDYSDRDEFMEKCLFKVYEEKIRKAFPNGVPKEQKKSDPSVDITEPINDLPF